MNPTLEGGCACGKMRYRLESKPMIVHCCHCRDCQRQTGSAFVLNALIERAYAANPTVEAAAAALRQAQELANGPTVAYGRLRQLLLRSSESSFESHLEEESRGLAETSRSPHGREGINAFIAKRKPDFSR